MNLISYNLSRRRLLVLFAFLGSSFLGFQPQSQPIAASDEPSLTAAQELTNAATPTRPGSARRSNLVASYPKNQIQIPRRVPPVRIKVEKKQDNLAKILCNLSKLGPAFPAAFSMSNFSMEGFVKGKWPIVVVYELEADSTVEVNISTSDGKLKFPITLRPTNGERKEVKERLPEGFGQKPQLGEVSFKAFKNGPEPRKPAHFFLYGLGFGDKAVGSILIDQLKFQPPTIRPKLNEKASYGFHSLSDFNSGSADFMRVTYPDNVYHLQTVARKKLDDGIGYDELLAKDWDGKNDKGKISPGSHQFRVRVWRALQSGGDWVVAFSKQVVNVK